MQTTRGDSILEGRKNPKKKEANNKCESCPIISRGGWGRRVRKGGIRWGERGGAVWQMEMCFNVAAVQMKCSSLLWFPSPLFLPSPFPAPFFCLFFIFNSKRDLETAFSNLKYVFQCITKYIHLTSLSSRPIVYSSFHRRKKAAFPVILSPQLKNQRLFPGRYYKTKKKKCFSCQSKQMLKFFFLYTLSSNADSGL